MNKVVESLDSLASVSIKVKVDVYGRKGGSKIFTADAVMQRDQKHTLNILGEQENFSSPEYRVNVDHEEKTVLVVKRHVKQPKEKLTLDPADMKAIMKLLSAEKSEAPKKTIKLISDEGGLRKYSVTNLDGIHEVQVILDMNSLVIRKITYQYTDESEYRGQYIQLDYTEFKKNPDLSGVLTTARYFKTEKDKIILNASCKGYKLYTEL